MKKYSKVHKRTVDKTTQCANTGRFAMACPVSMKNEASDARLEMKSAAPIERHAYRFVNIQAFANSSQPDIFLVAVFLQKFSALFVESFYCHDLDAILLKWKLHHNERFGSLHIQIR